MELYLNSITGFSKLITGDNEKKGFIFQKALLKLLGFYWWSGGVSVPFPPIVTEWLYPMFYPLLLILVSLLSVKATIAVQPEDDYNFLRKINGFIVSMTYTAAALKSIYLRINSAEVKSLIETLEGIGQVDKNQTIEKTFKICIYYVTLLTCNPLTWTFYYLVVHWGDTPFFTDYPWNMEDTTGYTIGYVITFITAGFCVSSHALVDTILPMSVAVVITHIDRIKEIIAKLGNGTGYDQRRIIDVVRIHVQLIRVNEKINQCFGMLFVVQTVYTVLHACVLIFAVVKIQRDDPFLH